MRRQIVSRSFVQGMAVAVATATCVMAAAASGSASPLAASPLAASPQPQVDRDIEAMVDEAALRFAIPPRWIYAVMRRESAGNARAVSPKGASGLMQIMPVTWAALRLRYRLGDDIFDPRDNILAGAAYLRELYDRYGSPGFLAAYNAGPARYEAWLRVRTPLPDETIAYVSAVGSALDKSTVIPRAAPVNPGRDWSTSALFVGGGRVIKKEDHAASRLPSAVEIEAPSQGRPAGPSLFALVGRAVAPR